MLPLLKMNSNNDVIGFQDTLRPATEIEGKVTNMVSSCCDFAPKWRFWQSEELGPVHSILRTFQGKVA